MIQPGNDRWGSAFWCGSAAVIRREALLGVGGIATETITEDFHTSLKLHASGWRIRYHAEPLCYGIAPHNLDQSCSSATAGRAETCACCARARAR